MYVKLFEDFKNKMDNATTGPNEDWKQVRDAIQSKLPYIIIVFKNRDSWEKATDSEFKGDSYIKQTAILTHDGKVTKYPSLFLTLSDDSRFMNKIQNLYSKFKIKLLILNSKGEDYSQSYSQDGSSQDMGNEIVTSLDSHEMGEDTHFKLGSMYYRFGDF